MQHIYSCVRERR